MRAPQSLRDDSRRDQFIGEYKRVRGGQAPEEEEEEEEETQEGDQMEIRWMTLG